MSDHVEFSTSCEYFEYPSSWEAEYQAERTVEEWRVGAPDLFNRRLSKRRAGNLQYFAQYALMYLLRREYQLDSHTFFHLASVDQATKRRVLRGEPWKSASPSPSRRDPALTERRSVMWASMREQMGSMFEILQEALIRGGSTGYQGEPDLFCYSRDRGLWFFAEAKTASERILSSQHEWFSLAQKLPGMCPIFLCRVVPQGYVRPKVPRHTVEWDRTVGHG